MSENGKVIYELDPASALTVAELRETMRPATTAIAAVLRCFIRQHNLEGNFMLADNGREIIRQDNPSQVVP